MPPFRPANLNKRAYPGNASVIGPTCTATLGFTTSNVGFTTSNSCAACVCCSFGLGCRCSFCGCPFCNIVCACPQTLCDRTVPSGRWKASEQYEARTRDAWGDDTCVIGSPTCVCCINVGFACTSNLADCKGFFICCQGASKWFVAPSCTQIAIGWDSRSNAVTCANSLMGSCGWFIPNVSQLYNPGFVCRTYWDNYSNPYWSDSEHDGPTAYIVNFNSGCNFNRSKGNGYSIRAFRCA